MLSSRVLISSRPTGVRGQRSSDSGAGISFLSLVLPPPSATNVVPWCSTPSLAWEARSSPPPFLLPEAQFPNPDVFLGHEHTTATSFVDVQVCRICFTSKYSMSNGIHVQIHWILFVVKYHNLKSWLLKRPTYPLLFLLYIFFPFIIIFFVFVLVCFLSLYQVFF